MSYPIERLKNLIDSLDAITDADRALLYAEVKFLKKDLEKNDFRLSRISQDKRIAEKVLNNTIQHLEEKQEEIQQINKNNTGNHSKT